jgi:SAM-dependent methyltransferase
MEERLSFQAADLDDLPYQDDSFDLTIGEVALGATVDPAAAIRELVRVTRPLGSVVLVQLVWTGHLGEDRREALVQHLGARPMLLVEWKQLLRDAGCVDLHVEDWSDYASPFRPAVTGPFHDIAKIFTLRQKVGILRRALKRWGWRGVRGAIVREQEIHRLLTRERVLGLSMIKGTKWPAAEPTAR